MTAPASSSTVNANPSNATPSSIHANVIPSEVGWQFVPQYYTFVNKQPHRLHCFYTRNSTFIHGTEGEDGRPCYGQQEIHNKILSIGYQDCKVFIHSVDAQSSANGGIIIQVIGEMSNRGEPWRKFAQTFFLAEQPNGYFVLNDIFRFLKEESVDAEDEDQAHEQSDATVVSQPPSEVAPENVHDPAVASTKATLPTTATPDHVQPSHAPAPPSKPAAPDAHAPEPSPVVAAEDKKPAPNGIHHSPTLTEPEPAPPAPQAEPVKPSVVESIPPPAPPVEAPPQPAAPSPSTSQPAASPTPVPASAPTTTTTTPAVPATGSGTVPAPAAKQPASTSAPAPSPKPAVPAAPPAPKTWANLAAANSNKWGPQVAQEARGVSAAPPLTPTSAPKPEAHRPGVAEKETRDGGRELHPAHQAALSIATPQCFVKSVTEVISHQALSGTLTSRFGPIKELEIVRTKACAFLEFTTLDAARRAIVASLPVAAGGDGGVRIELEGGGSARISVETRKERSERPPPRPRTGGPGPERGGGGGGFRGASGRGRGGTGRGAAPGGNKP